MLFTECLKASSHAFLSHIPHKSGKTKVHHRYGGNSRLGILRLEKKTSHIKAIKRSLPREKLRIPVPSFVRKQPKMVLVVDGRELRKGRERALAHSAEVRKAQSDLRSGRIFFLGVLLEGVVYYGAIIVLVGLLLTQSKSFLIH